MCFVEFVWVIFVFCVGGVLIRFCDRFILFGVWLVIGDIDIVFCVGVRFWGIEVIWDIGIVFCVVIRFWDIIMVFWVVLIRCDDVVDVIGEEGWIFFIEELYLLYVWKLKGKKFYLIYLWIVIFYICYILEEIINEEKNVYFYNLIVDCCKCNMDWLKDKCFYD